MLPKSFRPLSSALAFASLLASPSFAQSSPTYGPPAPLVAPIDSSPKGQTYGRWAAQWEQWALQIPAAESPITDTTGGNCGQRQVDEVWFLAGSQSSAPVVRSCTIPWGKSLFFPLINNYYGAFLNDPADTRTEAYVRNAAMCTQPAQISVLIDGKAVDQPQRFFTGKSGSQSPIFNAQLPPENIFGLTPDVASELALSPSAEQGYYLFLNPLTLGKHTIKWRARGCTANGAQDITYNLTVKG